MKAVVTSFAFVVFASTLMPFQVHADDSVKPVCLDPTRIDRTEIVDDSTILFHMKGGEIWQNKLQSDCVGLKIEGGFSYDVRGNMICSNTQEIQILHQGTVCSLGEFTPYKPGTKVPAN